MDDGHLDMPEEMKSKTAEGNGYVNVKSSGYLQEAVAIEVRITKCHNGYILYKYGPMGCSITTMIASSFDDAIEIVARWMGERG